MGEKVQSLDRLLQILLEKGSVNVMLGAWCDTQDHPSVMAALALLGKQVMDEARPRPRLTPKSPRGDAAVE